MNKKLLIFATFSAFLVLAWLIIISFLIAGQKNDLSTKVVPVPTDFKKNYSNFYKITPGKSTLQDVKATNGLPSSVSSSKEGTFLHYKTPSPDFENIVFLQNDIVVYALENVFFKYKGYYSDYVKKYGNPNLHLYNSNGNPFEWYVFINQGLAIEQSNNEITAILYFAPQSKEQFMATIAKYLNLTTAIPTSQGEPLVP